MDEVVLETERLTLRWLRQQDFDAFAEMMADREVARWLGRQPMSRENAWRAMATHAGHWLLRGYGQWAAISKEDGRFVGRVGLWNPEGWPGIEVGWAFARPYWGRGLATEGGRAALEWAWDTLEVDEIVSVILPDNAASIAVATKLGLSFWHTDTVRGFEQHIYRIARPGR